MGRQPGIKQAAWRVRQWPSSLPPARPPARRAVSQALEHEAARRLPWVVRLVQAEARQRCIFSSTAQLAKTAAACCYSCTVSARFWRLAGRREGMLMAHAAPVGNTHAGPGRSCA